MEAELSLPVPDSGDSDSEADPASVLETVANEYCQRILLLLSSCRDALTAQEISERTDCPLSTTYRKLEVLERDGLVAKRFTLQRHGKPTGRYTVSTDGLFVRFTDRGLEIDHY